MFATGRGRTKSRRGAGVRPGTAEERARKIDLFRRHKSGTGNARRANRGCGEALLTHRERDGDQDTEKEKDDDEENDDNESDDAYEEQDQEAECASVCGTRERQSD